MSSILGQLQELKSQDKPLAFNTRKNTCKCLIPVLLGLCRAMGRFSRDPDRHLTQQIFPGNQSSSTPVSQENAGDINPVMRMKGYTNFR